MAATLSVTEFIQQNVTPEIEGSPTYARFAALVAAICQQEGTSRAHWTQSRNQISVVLEQDLRASYRERFGREAPARRADVFINNHTWLNAWSRCQHLKRADYRMMTRQGKVPHHYDRMPERLPLCEFFRNFANYANPIVHDERNGADVDGLILTCDGCLTVGPNRKRCGSVMETGVLPADTAGCNRYLCGENDECSIWECHHCGIAYCSNTPPQNPDHPIITECYNIDCEDGDLRHTMICDSDDCSTSCSVEDCERRICQSCAEHDPIAEPETFCYYCGENEFCCDQHQEEMLPCECEEHHLCKPHIDEHMLRCPRCNVIICPEADTCGTHDQPLHEGCGLCPEDAPESRCHSDSSGDSSSEDQIDQLAAGIATMGDPPQDRSMDWYKQNGHEHFFRANIIITPQGGARKGRAVRFTGHNGNNFYAKLAEGGPKFSISCNVLLRWKRG